MAVAADVRLIALPPLPPAVPDYRKYCQQADSDAKDKDCQNDDMPFIRGILLPRGIVLHQLEIDPRGIGCGRRRPGYLRQVDNGAAGVVDQRACGLGNHTRQVFRAIGA